jgi:tetratricopeptide (TPR) repeat protein
VTPLPPSAPDKGRGGAARSAELDDLLAWIALAGPSASASLLASLQALPRWLVEAKLEELALSGAVRRLADGRVELRVAPAAPFPPERQRAAHRAIAEALSPGSDRRLFHLVAGYEITQEGSAAEIGREACALARRQARDGHLGQALATLREGLLALRRRPDPSDSSVGAEEVALLSLWAEIALFEGTPHAIDRLLHELCRAVPQTSAIAHLEALARAALAFSTGSERALAMTDAVPPFGDVRLERARQGIRVLAARRASQERLAAVLDEVAAWAKERAEPEADAALAGWLGRLRYQQGRFDEAAELHAKAAAQEPWIIARIAALFHGASSLLEAFRHPEAAAVAREALDLAERCRHVHHEAACAWMLRTVAYRTAAPIDPDPELIAAVTHVGTPDVEASIYFTEACILWRAGRLPEAADIAERAHKIWSGMRKQWPALLARCLSLRCRPAARRSEALSLAERAIQCPVHGMGIQALGLLAPIEPAVRLIAEPEAGRLSAEVPLRFWSMRIDVLSVLEALSALDIQGLPGR